MTRVRVLLVDDHPVVRGGLRALIEGEADMTVVGEVADGLAAVAAALELSPDVVVMDLVMPKLGGAEATEKIRGVAPDTKILVLTAHEEYGYIQLVLTAGAAGYVVKRAAPDELVRAIRVVAAGGTYVDPAVARQLVPITAPRAPTDAARLSEREGEVLRQIAQGHAMKEIASRLRISTRTLETYKARAMDKLGLKTRAEIVRYALQCGWLKDA